MAASPALFSSLTFPNSKIANPNLSFPKISFSVRKGRVLTHLRPVNPAGSSPSSSARCNSAAITNSLALDHESINDELEKAESKFGSKVRVKVPLKVYHVPKAPEIDLSGKIGVLKQYVGVYKGKRISPNFPYKAEFVVEEVLGRDGKPVKFLAHLREDEFEFLD